MGFLVLLTGGGGVQRVLLLTSIHKNNNNNRILFIATEKTMGRGGAGECGAAEPPDL